MIPNKLKPGDEVRVVSPSSGLGFIPADRRRVAAERLEGLGLRVSYGGAGEVLDRFESSPVQERVSELHDAFADTDIAGLLTIIGGYNSNQLLGRLDYDLFRENPKVLSAASRTSRRSPRPSTPGRASSPTPAPTSRRSRWSGASGTRWTTSSGA